MLIFAAVLAIFVYGMIAAMLGIILPELSDRFHLTPAQNGTIAFSQALGLIIASVGVARCSITKATRPASFSDWPSSLLRSSPCRAPAAFAASLFCSSSSASLAHCCHRSQRTGQRSHA